MAIKLISMDPVGGSKYTVNVNNTVLSIEIKYNYSTECWLMDIYNSSEALIVAGIMLVPNIDLLAAFTRIKENVGTFVLYELNEDDYKSPDLFGINTKLVWYSSSDEILSL